MFIYNIRDGHVYNEIVTPVPNTVIMEFKTLNKKINIKEQILTTPERNRFAIVEWGGVKIK